MLSFFPRDVLDEVLDLIKSVSEGFPTYSFIAHSFSLSPAAPAAQCVKRWPADLAITGQGEIFSTVNGVSLHTTFHYNPPMVRI